MSAYGRVNRGGHFLDFDNGIRGATTGETDPMQIVRNYEVGFKFQNDLVYADISAYFRDFTGLAYQQTTADGEPTGERLFYGSESQGINFIGAITPGDHFRFTVVANYLDGEYTDFDACFQFTNVVTGNGCAPIEGEPLQRQPKLRYMLTPSYQFEAGGAELEAFVTFTHVGDHTQDQSGLQQLGSYQTLDAGVTASVGDHWQFSVRGSNLSDELGLTESNSRIFGVAADEGGVLLARPLEGREINFQAKYLF
jgi:outer membrane receptor protein involved in Fe transport